MGSDTVKKVATYSNPIGLHKVAYDALKGKDKKKPATSSQTSDEGGAALVEGFEFPEARSYAEEYRDTLLTQIGLAPQLYAAEAEWGPKYALLEANTMKDVLSGQGGLLDYYEKTLAPAESRMQATANRTARESDIRDIAELGPASREAIAGAMDPRQKQILDMLSDQAVGELQAGGDLAPDELRFLQQNSRQAWEDRGLARSNPAVLDELQQGFAGRESRLKEARGFAGDVLRYNQAIYMDPLMGSVLSRQSAAPSLAQGTVQGVSGMLNSGPDLFNGESAYAQNLYGQNVSTGLSRWGTMAGLESDRWNTMFNAGAAQDLASQNNKYALYGAGISGLGSLLGGWLSGL